SEEPRESGALAQGIPGALTNQPPGVAPAAAGVNANAPAAPVGIARTATRNFEVDKTISHTTQALGVIQRLSIGVLLDNKPPANGTGPGEPIAEEELDSLTQLVQQSVGFDAARGDTISMVNQQFQQAPVIQPPEPPPIWQQPAVWDIARQVVGAGLVLVLAFVVVRPIMTSLTRPQPAMPLLDSAHLGGQPGYALTGSAPALPAGYDDRVTAARSVAGQDPRQIAQVMRNWVAEDNG
ncbi:MAG: flagellar M-ring protein FliF C-terminal domain-containing protein, partial [Gammaproteobacteria bacterium]